MIEEDLEFYPRYFNPEEYTKSIFLTNVVFGTVPIGNPLDMTINLIEHIRNADIILVENHIEFARLLTHMQQSPYSRHIFAKPKAVIYQYDLHSDTARAEQVIDELVEKSKTKKILVVSDEGSSLFLEPGQTLKNRLVASQIPFNVISGPVSAIQAVISSRAIQDVFFFGSSLPAIPHENREELFNKIKVLGYPVVFLLTAKDAKDCIESIKKYLPDWLGDFSINLTMTSEKHVYGTMDDILDFIDTNYKIFIFDAEYKKFAIFIYPQNLTSPHVGYKHISEENDRGYQR